MVRRRPRSTRTDRRCPDATLFRAAYELGDATDPTSAVGGILAVNTALDAATAKAILGRQFVEVLIAPDYEPGALEYAAKKAKVRVLKSPHGDGRNNVDVQRVGSGLLMQDSDNREEIGRASCRERVCQYV